MAAGGSSTADAGANVVASIEPVISPKAASSDHGAHLPLVSPSASTHLDTSITAPAASTTGSASAIVSNEISAWGDSDAADDVRTNGAKPAPAVDVAVSIDVVIQKLWASGNPTNNLLPTGRVSKLLSTSGLATPALRTIWTQAKASSSIAKGAMNEEEFKTACKLAVGAGGAFTIAKQDEAGVLDSADRRCADESSV